MASSESEYQLPPQSDISPTDRDSMHSTTLVPTNKSCPINSDYQPIHFFSPLKQKSKPISTPMIPSGMVDQTVNLIETERLRPDFHVSNVLAAPISPGGAIKKQPQSTVPKIEPIYAEVIKKSKCSSPSTFQVRYFKCCDVLH